MEDHKVSRPPHVSVRNRYTIFLCEEDWDRLRDRKDQLADRLERHLAKHVRAKKYQTAGDISVEVLCDPDLKPGHFGVRAEKDSNGFVGEALPGRLDGASPGVSPDEPLGIGLLGPGVPPGPAAGVPRLSTKASKSAAAVAHGRSAGVERENGSTKVIPPAEAAELGLARETIVIRSGNRVREFSQGRVVVGRASDADFRIDNPDVSRRHAALYWSNGKIVIEDLASTNGTMVNGYPVSNTVVTPSDVIVIGDCKLSVQAR